MSVDSYHAILLAAGKGSRFGSAKLTAKLNDTMIFYCALKSALAAPAASVIVVTGSDADAIEAAVEAYQADAPPIHTLYCSDYALGMSASLRCGLDALPDDAVGALIFLGDMPHVPLTIGRDLIDAVGGGAMAAVPVFEGRLGHPVLIDRALFARFSEIAGDSGGRSLLKDLGVGVALVPSEDDGILIDIDTIADLKRAESHRR